MGKYVYWETEARYLFRGHGVNTYGRDYGYHEHDMKDLMPEISRGT
ncbi:MAG: hypothetical protein MjAS7_2309 [Metallosphaera javensis (ex Sakai et al. 2022)]|nr:MAG: hypothetical protein MjAS7_2309 [Metallosphaera javensis (ex Sakai et al. 2022)]